MDSIIFSKQFKQNVLNMCKERILEPFLKNSRESIDDYEVIYRYSVDEVLSDILNSLVIVKEWDSNEIEHNAYAPYIISHYMLQLMPKHEIIIRKIAP